MIKAINTGKSEDIYGLSIENIIFAGEEVQHHLRGLINNITAQDSIPELIKVGLLSPIYKSKGDKTYRVLPTYRSSTMMFLLFLCFLIIW
jgi:hypothetical protein